MMTDHPRLVTTRKRRFVHVAKFLDGRVINSICGAHPWYYGGKFLIEITEEEAKDMHHCKRCFPPRRES